MTVREMINLLMDVKDKDASIVTEKGDGNGCDSCGWGETSTTTDIKSITDLETRIVLNLD